MTHKTLFTMVIPWGILRQGKAFGFAARPHSEAVVNSLTIGGLS